MADPLQHSLSSHSNQVYLKQSGGSKLRLGNPIASRGRDDSRSNTFYTVHSKKADEILEWKQYQLYSCWNATRFLVAAILVCVANFHHNKQLQQYTPDCCGCFYVAQAISSGTEIYDIDSPRIDWSYCMPKCVDCTYCSEKYHNATEAFNNDVTCPADQYNPTKDKMKWDWDQQCPEAISISSFKFFLKDYRVYGVSTIIIVFLYIVLMVAFVYGCKNYGGFNSGTSLLIYNIIVSINTLYAMFKPMQYYHHVVENTNGSVCMVDSITDHMEDILTYCVYLSIGFISLQWLVGMFGCLVLRKANRINPSQGTVGMVSNQVISIYMAVEKFITVCCALLALLFYGALIRSSEQAITARVHEAPGRAHEDAGKIAVLVIVDFLCILSVFDIFCCPFCRKTARNYCGVCRKREDQQADDKQPFYQLMGDSPTAEDEHRRTGTYPLQTIEDQAEDL